MRFTLRQLQVFTAIAQSGNVTEAAKKLAMSQSAASTALAELEHQFDRSLFDRMGKRLRLNEAGRAALPKAREMLDRASEMESLLAGGGGPGDLRLGASLTIGNYIAPLLIERYMRRYPTARVALSVDNSSRVSARVADHDIDLALVEGQTRHTDLEAMDWVGDELTVFCAPTHPLATGGPVGIERLLDEDWVVREAGSGTRQTLDRAMTDYWPRWKIAFELEHTEAIKSLVAAGRGIGCISRLALRAAVRNRTLIELPTPALDLRRRFYFLFNREKYRSRAADAFVAICREVTGDAARSDEIVF
jgi:DNA-binding transcriptional LysR family regulator